MYALTIRVVQGYTQVYCFSTSRSMLLWKFSKEEFEAGFELVQAFLACEAGNGSALRQLLRAKYLDEKRSKRQTQIRSLNLDMGALDCLGLETSRPRDSESSSGVMRGHSKSYRITIENTIQRQEEDGCYKQLYSDEEETRWELTDERPLDPTRARVCSQGLSCQIHKKVGYPCSTTNPI